MNRDERFLMTHFRCAKRFSPPNVIMQSTYTWWIGGNFSHFQIVHFSFRSGAESYSRKWNARKFTTTQPVISIRYFCSFCVIGMSINLSVSIVRTCNLISFQSTFCLNLTAEHDVEEKQNVPPELELGELKRICSIENCISNTKSTLGAFFGRFNRFFSRN